MSKFWNEDKWVWKVTCENPNLTRNIYYIASEDLDNALVIAMRYVETGGSGEIIGIEQVGSFIEFIGDK